MRRRRNLIIPLLLIAAMVIGIGYAFETRELAIGGMAQLARNDSAFDVSFVEAKLVESKPNDPAPVNPELVSDTVARYTITGLAGAGDYVVMKFIVKNRTQDVTAALSGLNQTRGSIILGSGASEVTDTAVIEQYFEKEVKMYHSDADGNAVGSGFVSGVAEITSTYVYDENNLGSAMILAPNEYATVEVRVELLQTLGANGVPTIITLNGASIALDFDDLVNP